MLRLCLVLLNGPFRGHAFPLIPGHTFTLGRRPPADLLLPSGYLSPRHCQLRHAADGVWVRDLDSDNGTWLKGKLAREDSRMRLDDVVQLGRVELRLSGEVRVEPDWLRWNGGELIRLAQHIADNDDFAALPILADALEDAGCTNADILAYCREGREHLGGSWLVDVLLEQASPAAGEKTPSRLALISDVHGNFEALERVMGDIEVQRADAVYFLGDALGYGPNPRECVDLVRMCRVALMGEFEQATLFDAEGFTTAHFAERSILWGREQLESQAEHTELRQRRWAALANWPRQHREGNRLFVHGSPRNPINEYFFPEDIYNPTKMERNFALVERYCFQGHSHVPGVFIEEAPGGPYRFHSPEEIDPEEINWVHTLDGRKTMVNVGSVGQPRDGDRRACYVLLQGDTVTFRRLEYDIDTTIRKIYAIPELENFLGDRLREGR